MSKASRRRSPGSRDERRATIAAKQADPALGWGWALCTVHERGYDKRAGCTLCKVDQ